MRVIIILCALMSYINRIEARQPGFGPVQWQFQTDGKCFHTPVIYHNMVLFGADNGTLYAVNRRDGREVWRFQCKQAIGTSPVIEGDQVFFGCYDGYYYALNAETGNLLWRFATGGESKIGAKGLWTMQPDSLYMEDLYDYSLSTPAVNEHTTYFGSSDGNVYAVDKLTGLLQWKFSTQGKVHGGVTVQGNRLYVGSWDRNMYALNAQTGLELWRYETGKDTIYHVLEGIQSTPVIADETVYFGSRDAHFYALNARTGQLKWKHYADNAWIAATALIDNGHVYVGTSDSYLLLTLDAQTGRVLHQLKGGGYIFGPPAGNNNYLYYADFTGRVHMMDKQSGKRLDSFDTQGRKQYASTVLDSAGNLNFMYTAGDKDARLYSTNVEVMGQFFKLAPIIGGPVVDGQSMYFTNANGQLFAVAFKTR